MNDGDVPSFNHDQPVPNEPAIDQFVACISWLCHDYLGLNPERLRANQVMEAKEDERTGFFALVMGAGGGGCGRRQMLDIGQLMYG